MEEKREQETKIRWVKESMMQLRTWIQDFRPSQLTEAFQNSLPSVVEILVILVFTLLFCKPYLNFSETEVPIGREFLSTIQMHHIWNDVFECGSCAFWYGNVAGGFPSFIDPTSSILHPFVALGTIILGVINGAKLALVGTYLLVGIGHLWFGRLLGVRRIVRIWGAGMAITAGHLAPRMELGAFNLVLSMGTISIAIPALIRFTRNRDRRAIVLLSIVAALVIISGNGYVQVGLLFCLLSMVFLIPWNREQLTKFLSAALIVIVLALLLASPFLVPFGHFLPEFAKDFDLEFKHTQPFSYVPLNLVIRDINFYLTDILGKPAWIAHFAFYLGWIPILLAVWGLIKARDPEEKKVTIFLASFAFIALFIASGVPLAWIVEKVKLKPIAEFIAGVRYISFVTGLAIPAIICLAVIGLDQIFDLGENKLTLRFEQDIENASVLRIDLRWFLTIPLVAALSATWTFNRQWIDTLRVEPYILPILDALETANLEWVDVPFGEHYFVEPAVRNDLKLAKDFFRTWHWRDRQRPEPYLEANRGDSPDRMMEIQVVGDFHIHKALDGREYARIVHLDGTSTLCAASGTGGHIDVTCPESRAGTLIVLENKWTGWEAELDGSPKLLEDDVWLSVKVAPGQHQLSLRYRPWDVYLGLLFFMIGLVVCAVFWVRPHWKGVPG